MLPTLALVLAVACTAAQVPYEEEIAGWRAQKDEFMKSSSESPVPPEQRASFPPLAYFPVDPDYRVPAELKVVQSDVILEMDTSTGTRRRMRRVGTLGFTVKGQRQQLTAFVDDTERDMRRLFVPFGDLTNGTETYPGGRYLDLDRTATNFYDLDFNRGYHPFCLYNPSYECPVPPRENRLPLPVRAGEKLNAASK